MKNDIIDLIRRLNRILKRHEANRNPVSYGRGQGRLLRLIMENEGITAHELANMLDVRPPSLTEKVNRLSKDGKVLRERDTGDLRVVHIYITDKGREAVAQREEDKNAGKLDFTDCFSPEENAMFCELSNRLIDRMNEIVVIERAEAREKRRNGLI